ncbi:DUF559 domain-containing protein [Demequina sp. NBRC 110052]|uniref:DUF559 domain-containing protein n=1 Tax=Demequina sp. NBRC 110052 TaxID=1570341 RepID=UPI0011805F9F|nr:DUF559 domain-containing protein [Demequina sp. NBRC 110052]
MSALLAASPQCFTFEELVALSSHRAARTAIESGHAVRLLPNCYVGVWHAESFTARAGAVLQWLGDGAALTGCAALFAWGVLTRAPRQIRVLVTAERRPRPPEWVRVTRSRHEVETTTQGGYAVVPLAVALVRSFEELSDGEAQGVVYEAVQRRKVTPRALDEALRILPRVARRREIQSLVDDVTAGAHSYLESVALHHVFFGGMFERLLRQHTVVVEGRKCVLDMYDPATRTCIEVDGAAHHSSPAARQSDVERDVMLATIGVQTLRFTYRDIVDRPSWCRAMASLVLRLRVVTAPGT